MEILVNNNEGGIKMSVLFWAVMILIFVGAVVSEVSVKMWVLYNKPIWSIIITIVYFLVAFSVIGLIYFLKIDF